MASFKSPALASFASLTAALSKIPSQNRDALQELSGEASALITASDALHVYEIGGEPDDLVLLTVQIEWLKKHPREDHRGTKVPAGAIFLASNRNRSFGRVVEQLEHLTSESPQRHLAGHVALFGPFAVVRTADSTAQTPNLSALQTATKNITTTLSQLSKLTHTAKYVWHHGPYLRSLTHFIANTTPAIRNALLALTVCAAITSLDAHAPNTPADWRTLETYARRLRLPIILISPDTIPLQYTYLNHLLKNFGELVPALFPASVYTENVNHHLDLAHVLVYRVAAAAAHRHSRAVASKVAAALPAHHAGVWPKACIRPEAYPPERCRMKRALAAMKPLAWYTDMGMMPLGSAQGSTAALARVLLGPGRPTDDATLCVPVEIAARGGRAFRISSAGTFCVYTLNRIGDGGKGGGVPEALYHALVTKAVLGGVEGFVKEFYERGKNEWGYQREGLGQVPDGVAVMWGEVYQGLIQQLRGLAQGEAGQEWAEEERRDVQSVVKALGTGSFTTAVVGVLRKRERRGKGNGCWISG
ncbi:uncharacterized protein BDZ99DRAFT_569765 [Mytilinidion resinicola]|uniref:Uncharacterized protein n=1 Tax=Mytilinidion resinicola TaxID=574789 RepID=A0A6A6YUY3_9PEZI|nr:uncharacterized protein BDZ99DRAFT_569765 [Mytilinidion resinicola]KAF2811804.1 hypothetical protein BDZ99DRAFT_569765 [Mytilinidion resinicola]